MMPLLKVSVPLPASPICRTPLPVTLVAMTFPPLTVRSALVALANFPRPSRGVMTRPLVQTTRPLEAPAQPTCRLRTLVRTEPAPMTVTRLLVEEAAKPITPAEDATVPPLVIRRWLLDPEPP